MKRRVLIVDDEPNILKSLSSPLEREGYDVGTAAGYSDAVAANDGSYDCVLLDVWLPDGDGVALLETFRKQYPDQIIVMMSGHSTIGTAVRAVKSGAHDFLEKPLSLEKVLITVENALRTIALRKENTELKRTVGRKYELVGISGALQDIRVQIDNAASSFARTLIRGESGVGKEVIARQIHLRSSRAKTPFVAVNCAAVPDELIESELFGHGKGAFTGAIAQRVGKFEEADGGTLFLDEIGDMNLRAQAKVLRAIEEGEVEPLGGGLRKIDVRIIAATNKNLEEMIASGKFRSDLFFRLNVLCIEVPPLRSRREDVPVLAQHFCNKLCEEYGKKPVSIEEEALKTMSALDLPGNARELRNLVERALITNSFSTIKADDIKPTVGSLSAMRAITKPLKDALDDFERDYIERTLTACGGNMTDAASRLGLERSHLYKKMTSLGLR